MLGITDFGAFAVAVLVFLALPGPGTFALLGSTARGGLRAGALATAGVIVGDQILMWTAALGIAAVLQANPLVFRALQYAGAGYLAWIGIRLLLMKDEDRPPIVIKPRQYFRQALLITLLNPKAIVFYMAFFPLFIDPAQHRGVITFAAMALTIATLTAAYCLTLCAFANVIAARVKAHRRLASFARKGAGVFLIGFGVKLAQ